MIINLFRRYRKTFTEGELFVNGEFYCHVLEDIGRPLGVKIPNYTCIPEGAYKCGTSVSQRWNKPMMIIYNTKERTVDRGGVKFTGIRPHGGNDIDDTAGCPLLGYNTNGSGKIWNRASDDLFKVVQSELDAGETIYWIITEK